MANSITGVNDDIIAMSVLEAFVADMLPITVFATNFSDEARKKGDRVSVLRTITADEAALTKVTHADYTIQDADSDAVEVVLGQPDYVSWSLDDTEISQSSVVNMEVYGIQKGNKLATTVFQNILGAVTLANYGAAAFTGASSTFDADDVVDLRKVVTEAKWPQRPRSLVLEPAIIANLLKDGAIQDASAIGSTEPIREGSIGRLGGFDIFESTLIPANGQNLTGFAATPAGMAVAIRYLLPQEGHTYFRAEPLTDPTSQITLGLRDWYDNDSGVRKRVLECVYGKAVGISAGIKRIVSA